MYLVLANNNLLDKLKKDVLQVSFIRLRGISNREAIAYSTFIDSAFPKISKHSRLNIPEMDLVALRVKKMILQTISALAAISSSLFPNQAMILLVDFI